MASQTPLLDYLDSLRNKKVKETVTIDDGGSKKEKENELLWTLLGSTLGGIGQYGDPGLQQKGAQIGQYVAQAQTPNEDPQITYETEKKRRLFGD